MRADSTRLELVFAVQLEQRVGVQVLRAIVAAVAGCALTRDNDAKVPAHDDAGGEHKAFSDWRVEEDPLAHHVGHELGAAQGGYHDLAAEGVGGERHDGADDIEGEAGGLDPHSALAVLCVFAVVVVQTDEVSADVHPDVAADGQDDAHRLKQRVAGRVVRHGESVTGFVSRRRQAR